MWLLTHLCLADDARLQAQQTGSDWRLQVSCIALYILSLLDPMNCCHEAGALQAEVTCETGF